MNQDTTTWLIIGGLVLVGLFFMMRGKGFGGGGNGDTYSKPPSDSETATASAKFGGSATYT